MRSKVVALVGSLVLLVSIFTTTPANAVHTGQKFVNSSASDYWMQVNIPGKNSIKVNPGSSYTVKYGEASGLTVTVIGDSFRVRYDASSGPYQGCQDISSSGVKKFTPSNSPDRIDFLSYRNSDCTH